MSLPPEFIVQGLVERGVPLTAALGIAGNLSVESGFDPGINEIAPVVAGSRGGYGLAQWTGPRRRQLEAFAAERGVPVSDPNLQLDFLTWEMGNSERGNIADTLAATSPEAAAQEFMADFLRPGIPHADARLAATRDIAGAFGNGADTGSYAPDPSIAGAFAGYGQPPASSGGNALADLTLFGPSAPVQGPGQIAAPARGNALASLSGGQGQALGASAGFAMGSGGYGIPEVPQAPAFSLRPGTDAAVAQILAAFAPRPVAY